MAGSLNTPDVLTQPIAENGDKNTIPATNDQSLGQMSQSTGFPEICSERIADGGKAPRRADFNGAFNMLSRYIFFKQNGGIETFRADVSTAIGGYPKDAILGYRTSTEFKLVRSLIANNTYNFNTTPSYIDDGTHWESVIPMSKNISDWSTNVTNCLIEIPQDINLTLSNGTLTLKAGSKVTFPDGTVYTLSSDLSISTPGNGTRFMFIRKDNKQFTSYQATYCTSGVTDSLSGQGYHAWFDTTNNEIKCYTTDASTPSYTASFPICIETGTPNEVSSIDQVFNGFGYIGSTVFTLPGVKGLYPNGRNTDGTLKNGLVNCTSVQISSVFNDTGEHCLFLQTNGRCQWYWTNGFYYNINDNTIHASLNDTKLNSMDAGTFTTTNGVISNFKPNTVFHAVDYNDYQKTANQTNTNTTNITTLETSKANTSLDNVSAGIDFVVESQEPTALNNYTWYRKYKSGWVEQGGIMSGTGTETITLPVAMVDTNYTALNGGYYSTSTEWQPLSIQKYSTTEIKVVKQNTDDSSWMVIGKAA